MAADGSTTTTGPVTVAGDSTAVIVADEGVTTITATAVDVAGNAVAPADAAVAVVRIDQAAPVLVGCTGPPSPNQWFAANQTITCTVEDLGLLMAGA